MDVEYKDAQKYRKVKSLKNKIAAPIISRRGD